MTVTANDVEALGAGQAIAREVTGWEGVASAPHRFGGLEFRVGRRELGHLHGDGLADLPFTRAERDELIAAGRVREHRWVPNSGWASRDIHTPEDALDVIALFRSQYERAVRAQARRAGAGD
jgi:Family of unknown function (DUF5519)